MKSLFLAFSLLYSMSGFAQGKLSVDHTNIRIGDQAKATVTVDLSGGKEWINADKVWPDTIKGIEIISGPEWNKENPSAATATWLIAFFDTGLVRIPRLPLVIQQQGQSDTIYTNDIPISVVPVEPDSTGLKPIKEIYLQPFSIAYYKRYIPHAVILLLLIVGLIYWWRHRKRNEVLPEPPPVILLPHDWAYQELNNLAEKKLWQHGEVKEHYTLLTAILRQYLERRFGIHALEQTSDEIINQLRFLLMDEALLHDTEELLSVADLIKFAKADPGMDIHVDTIERVRTFVRNTTSSGDSTIATQNTSDEVVG